MIRNVNTRHYNTDKAANIGTYKAPNGYCETLYRKRNGEYFIHGYGGTDKDTITPITFEEAAEWARGILKSDEWQKMFGAPEETGEKTVLSITMTKTLAEALRREATRLKMSLSAFIEYKLSSGRK